MRILKYYIVLFMVAGFLLYEVSPKPIEAAKGATIKGTVTILKKGLFGKKGKKKDRRNVVVFLENLKQPDTGMKKVLRQKNKKFTPRVVPIVVGGKVSFPNLDPYNHNIFSPTAGYKFDLGYYGSGKSKVVRFPKTGAVRIYCNIHSNMVADVLVVPNKYYAMTGRTGKYIIKDVPPGKYTFVAWQPTGASEKRNIVVKAGQSKTVNFTVQESVFKVKHKNKFGQSYEKEY